MELKDTQELMVSANYKERFIAEYLQLKIRYEKLKTFCQRIEVAQMTNTEEPRHDCPLGLLEDQLYVMGKYLNLLEKRAILEHINLITPIVPKGDNDESKVDLPKESKGE